MSLLKQLPVILVTLALFLLVGCQRGPGDISASLGQRVSLSIGQSVLIQGEGLRVKFAQVIADSRCPTGVNCVWEGEITCMVEITHSGSLYHKTLTQPGSTNESSRTDFADYDITFGVQPYPEAGKQIARGDYRLEVVIDRKPALAGGILVMFDVVGETYSIFVTNPDTIEQILAVQRGESKSTIPSGRLVRRAVPYNSPWSWHIDPQEVGMAEVTVELCDGTPSQIEANLDYWVETVRYFCPWSARIVKIEDYR